MSRIPKWKLEKTKVKVVFRLQFHATHIPQPGWDKLFVSFIPAESGKATAKTTKANVRNGNCKWSDPIYETTRLLQDTVTKKYDEKLYKLVVAMGSSRSSLLGEVNINLADYADASKPFSVALPLHGCDFGTVLHVTVQLLTSKTGFREFEQQRELREKKFQMISGQSCHDPAENIAASLETAGEQIDKVNARVRFKPDSTELPSLEEVGGSNEDYADSAAGIDGSSYTSESLYAEKNDISSMHEIDSLKSTISGDIGGFPLGQSPRPDKEDQRDHRLLAQGSNDWIHGWSSDYSVDNDLTTAYEENNSLRGRLEVAESSILELKLEVDSLQSLADELGAETQIIAQQLATELASGEKLAKEVSILKSECSKFKNDFEEVKYSKSMQHFRGTSTQFPLTMKYDLPDAAFDGKLEDSALAAEKDYLFRDFQIKWSQGLLLAEEKIREIQNKTCQGYHGRNSDFVHADFEVLECLLQNLKQGTAQLTSLMEGTWTKDIQMTSVLQSEQFAPGQELETSYRDQCHSEGMPHCPGSSYPAYQECEPVEKILDAASMEEKICKLLHELEESKTEKESLMKKMGQMECYYEALIQELEESQKQMLNELEKLRTEHSTCFYTISALQNQIDKMHKDINEQFLRVAEDKHSFETLNTELEKRAVASETALKRVRWNYSIAVDRLQKDLELLSFQVLSMYETNENLARQAFTDVTQLSFHDYTEKSSEEEYSYLHQNGSLTSSHQEHCKGSVTRIEPEIESIKTGHELPRMLNGASEKVNCKNVHKFDFSVQNSGISRTGVSMHADLHVKDEGNVYLNGLKVEEIEQVASQHNIIQKKMNLVGDTDLFAATLENDKFPDRSTIVKSNLGSQGSDSVGFLQRRNQNAEFHNQLLEEKDGYEEMKRLLHMQKEIHSETEAKLSELHVLNLYLEVFSMVLQETLHDVNDGCRHMKENVEDLAQQLEHSTEVEESLMLKLRSACDEARILREDEAKFISRCDELSLVNHSLEAKLKDVSDENNFLTQKVTEYEGLIMECSVYESKYKACTEEREEFENLLKQESLKNSCLQSDISSIIADFKVLKAGFDKQTSVNDDLETTVTFLLEKLGDLCFSMVSCNEQINGPALAHISLQQELESKNYMAIVLHLEQLQQEAYKKVIQLSQEKKEIEEERNIVQGSLDSTESQILLMKQKCESDLEAITTKLELSNSLVEKLQQELQDVAEKLNISSETEEKHAMKNKELSSKLTVLETKLQHATVEISELVQKLLVFDNVNEELERAKISLVNCMEENRTLITSLQSVNESSIQKENELSSLKESLRYTHDKLQFEGGYRKELEAAIADLKLELKEKSDQLLSLNEQKAESIHLRQRVLDLESESSGFQHLLLYSKECQTKLDDETLFLRYQVADMESHVAATLEYLLAADVEVAFTRTQFQFRMHELIGQLKGLERDLVELHVKHLDVVASLKNRTASEAQLIDEKARLSTALQSLKNELEIVVCEKRDIVDNMDKNSAIWTELEDLKARAAMVEAVNTREKQRYEDEIWKLKNMLGSFEQEVNNLRSSRDELAITDVILRSKLDEQRTHISLLEECEDELRKLREQHNELTYKLSEQALKTEEFKNLSIHLRELKDKADAECQSREKRESEGPSLAMQESLRIAFIREQYETKLQELRSQLYASKKHGEEMLLKLQNALDEVENRKKSELSHLKRNEELSMKVSDLEAELQTVLTDRRELVKTCDRMKAELECSILSLDCCKEEKLKLEVSLQECNEERTKIRVELDLVKRLLENMASTTEVQMPRNLESGISRATSIGQLLEDVNSVFPDVYQEAPIPRGICVGEDTVVAAGVDAVNHIDNNKPLEMNCMLSSCGKVEDVQPVFTNECSQLTLQLPQALQDGPSSRSALEQENLLQDDTKHIADIKEHFKDQQNVKTGMDLLYKELERMKNENLASLLPLVDHHFDPDIQYLQGEMSQLDKANEHLGRIFPLFKEFRGSGNALERVLALELELATALQVKKNSDIRFQSSFLKQHSDEEAVFQSFRDINELIKDMLELKKRHAAVETELKEMHGRYSQLSLQFAEVEGERQKLVMTLKNRVPKRSVSSV